MRLIYALLFFLTTASYAKSLSMVAVPKSQIQWVEKRSDWSQDHFHHPEYVVGYLENLNNIPPQTILLNEKTWAVGGYDPKTFNSIPVRENPYEGYHDYKALTELLKARVQQYPDLLRLETAGKSVEGREIWYVVLSDKVNQDEGEPKFIYHANMHGDEVVGRELMLYFLDYMLDQYGKESRVTQIIDHSQIFIMPSMNPDGFEHQTRSNVHGKDLNRNFPDRFNSTSDTPNGREIEVQHMMELARQHHFVYGINWHGGEICFNLPWGNIKNTPANLYPDDSFFNPIGREYTQNNKTMYANHHDNFDHGMTYGYEWYPVNGGINDWFNFYRRSVHSVVELSYTKWPSASSLVNYWNDNRESMVTYLWRGLRGVHLKVVGASLNLPKDITISISSSKRDITFDTGYIHRLTGDSPQTVSITSPGFQKKELNYTPNYFDGTFQTVILEPN